MPHTVHKLPPGSGFWREAARVLVTQAGASALADCLVLVPTFSHIGLLRTARQAGGHPRQGGVLLLLIRSHDTHHHDWREP